MLAATCSASSGAPICTEIPGGFDRRTVPSRLTMRISRTMGLLAAAFSCAASWAHTACPPHSSIRSASPCNLLAQQRFIHSHYSDESYHRGVASSADFRAMMKGLVVLGHYFT